MDKEATKKAYNILDTLNTTLAEHTNSGNVIRDGSWELFNSTLEQFATGYSDDVFRTFKLTVHSFAGNPSQGVFTDDFKRKVYSAVQYCYKQYTRDFTSSPTSHNGGNSGGATIIQSQSANQNTEVNIEFNATIMQLTEELTKAQVENPNENSKENKFIKRAKELLMVTKNTTAIIAAILQAAHECGLSPADIQKLLHL